MIILLVKVQTQNSTEVEVDQGQNLRDIAISHQLEENVSDNAV